MEIGIITMHSVVHYGSVLQAYATQKIFESLGHHAVIINYCYPNKWQVDHGMSIFKPSLKTKLAQLLGLKPHNRKRRKILHFMKRHYHLTRKIKDINELENKIPKFDIYISGSDQIWNPRFTCADPAYFFAFLPKGANIMSLSSSFACKSLDSEIAVKYKEYLLRYKFISVRENHGVKIVNDLLHKTPEITLDPTLMISAKQWREFIKPSHNKGEYIFMYVLDYAFNPKPYIFKLAHYFYTQYNKKVISNIAIPAEYKIPHTVCDGAGIEEFLTLIDHSFLTITSSFHGLAFSVNFGKPVIGVVKDDSDDRLSSLLNSLNLEACIAKIGTPFENISPFYDFDKEQKKLIKLREITSSYLNTALSYFESHKQ